MTSESQISELQYQKPTDVEALVASSARATRGTRSGAPRRHGATFEFHAHLHEDTWSPLRLQEGRGLLFAIQLI